MPHLTLTQRIAAGCLGFLLSAPALAGDPITLRFQSRVTDAGGAPLTQTGLSVTTRLYSTALGGAPFWTETRMVDVQGGLVAFDLGDVTALDSELVAGPLPVFVGVTLGTDSEMAPRLRLNALPLAKHADTATSAVTAEAATTAVHATTADQALSADFATSAGNAASADFATTAASATSADDVPGKTINPKDIRIGGQYVIDKFGQWVGDPTGLQGPVGPEGPQGVPGVPGAQGVPGPQGPAGDSQFDAIGTGTVRFLGSAFAAALQLAPDAALGGGNSLIYFAEDASATDGTLVMHDGATDELRFWGLDGGVISGPHLAVDTQGGQVGIGTTPGFARLTLSAPAGTAALETVAGTNTRLQVNGLGGVSLGGPGPSVPGGSVFVNGQLGIGDSTPDAALDVVGDVLVSGDVTAATATRWANVTPASFVLVQGAAYEQNVTAANDLVIYANSATNVSFCDLDLPHGATIERLRWTGIDALSSQDSMLELQRIRRTSGAIDVLLQTPSVGNSVLLRTFQTPFVSSEVVDNDQYAYRLRLVLGASGSAGNVLHSAQVEYTTPSSLR